MAVSRAYRPTLPEPLRHLEPGMSDSRALLDLPHDWDDAGSPGYHEETWDRAAVFLLRSVVALWEEYGIVTDTATILPGPHGSIDLDWRARGRELLINVPIDPSASATYYGDNGSGRHRVKGTLDLGLPNRWLLLWLAE